MLFCQRQATRENGVLSSWAERNVKQQCVLIDQTKKKKERERERPYTLASKILFFTTCVLNIAKITKRTHTRCMIKYPLLLSHSSFNPQKECFWVSNHKAKSSLRFTAVPEVLSWRKALYKDSRGSRTTKVGMQAMHLQRLHAYSLNVLIVCKTPMNV